MVTAADTEGRGHVRHHSGAAIVADAAREASGQWFDEVRIAATVARQVKPLELVITWTSPMARGERPQETANRYD